MSGGGVEAIGDDDQTRTIPFPMICVAKRAEQRWSGRVTGVVDATRRALVRARPLTYGQKHNTWITHTLKADIIVELEEQNNNLAVVVPFLLLRKSARYVVHDFHVANQKGGNFGALEDQLQLRRPVAGNHEPRGLLTVYQPRVGSVALYQHAKISSSRCGLPRTRHTCRQSTLSMKLSTLEWSRHKMMGTFRTRKREQSSERAYRSVLFVNELVTSIPRKVALVNQFLWSGYRMHG